MKAVIYYDDAATIISFDRKIDNPWPVLAQIAQDIPGLMDKPIRFSKRIPEHDGPVYTHWECDGNSQPKVAAGKTFKQAVTFLRPKRSLRTLGELLQKYASASK